MEIGSTSERRTEDQEGMIEDVQLVFVPPAVEHAHGEGVQERRDDNRRISYLVQRGKEGRIET
jgi:hypothetical protein